MLIANVMPFLRRYDRRPLIQPILFKTMFYWVIVAVVRVLEHFMEYSRKRLSFDPFFASRFALTGC